RLRRLPACPRRRRPPTRPALRPRGAERLACHGPGRRRRHALHDPGARACRVSRRAPAPGGDQRPQCARGDAARGRDGNRLGGGVETGIGWEEGGAALGEFRGVRRRQEVVGEARGVTVIDDFAHHPTAIAGTLAALRARYPGRRLRAVFEPRSNTSRRRVFQEAFTEALAGADEAILAAVYGKANDPIPPEE